MRLNKAVSCCIYEQGCSVVLLEITLQALPLVLFRIVSLRHTMLKLPIDPHHPVKRSALLCFFMLATSVMSGAEEQGPGTIKGDPQPEVPAEPATEAPIPQERPRLFHPTDLHPYAGGGNLYLDPWFYGGDTRGYGYAAGYYGDRWGYPFGYGFGYRSHLYYDTFYGILPAPGHSEVSVSIGSDNYFGSSLSTSTYLSQKHNLVLNIAALWETGEQWWNGQDYDSFTIAPTLYWSNENTLIYVGFQYSERNYAEPVSSFSESTAATVTPTQRQRITPSSSDSSMSPFRDQIALQGETGEKYRSPGFGFRTDTDHTIKSATIGIDHQLTDSLRIGFNFEARDFDRKSK